MSVQRFPKLEEALELLNSLDSDESDIEIAVLPDTSEITDEEGDDNEVNTSEIIIKVVPWSTEQMETALKDETPSELFEQFYSSEAYDLNAKEAMRYAADVSNEHDFLTTADEIRVFIGILL
ncbi:uncharacterized protein TNCV_1883231 [Trichonephila clavipes]|nr:uncharacterized protein TNCV_1883231 [Trichonephila clavipes]